MDEPLISLHYGKDELGFTQVAVRIENAVLLPGGQFDIQMDASFGSFISSLHHGERAIVDETAVIGSDRDVHLTIKDQTNLAENKQKQSLYFPEDMLKEIQEDAAGDRLSFSYAVEPDPAADTVPLPFKSIVNADFRGDHDSIDVKLIAHEITHVVQGSDGVNLEYDAPPDELGISAIDVKVNEIALAGKNISSAGGNRPVEPLIALNYDRDELDFSHVALRIENAAHDADDGSLFLDFRDTDSDDDGTVFNPAEWNVRKSFGWNRGKFGDPTPILQTEWNAGLTDQRLQSETESSTQLDDRLTRIDDFLHIGPPGDEPGPTIDIEMVALSLQSVQPIDIQIDIHDTSIGDLQVHSTTANAAGVSEAAASVVINFQSPLLPDPQTTLMVKSRNMAETSVVNSVPATGGGDPDRPLIAGFMPNTQRAGKPLLIVAEDIEGEALSIYWRETGGLGPPLLQIDASTDSMDRVFELATQGLLDIDLRYRGSERQRLDLTTSGLTGPIDLQVGTDIVKMGDTSAVFDTEILALSLSSANQNSLSNLNNENGPIQLDLNLVSPPTAPVFAAIAIPNLIEARKHGNEAAVRISASDPVVVHDFNYRTAGAGLVESAQLRGTLDGGFLDFMRNEEEMAIWIDGAEISGEFFEALITEVAVPALDVSGSPSAFKVAFDNVIFRNCAAEVIMTGPTQFLNLHNVDVIDSDLQLTNTLTKPTALSKPFLMPVEDVFTITGRGTVSHSIVGTPYDDVILGYFNVLVGPEAEYEMTVDTGKGDDDFVGNYNFLIEIEGVTFESTGIVSLKVNTGEDDDKVTMGVFHGESLTELLAILDSGTDADKVLATENVTLVNEVNFRRVPRPVDDDDSDAELDSYLKRIHDLFLNPDNLQYGHLQGEALGNRRYLYFAKTADVD